MDDRLKILQLENALEIAKLELKFAERQMRILEAQAGSMNRKHDRVLEHSEILARSIQVCLTNNGQLASALTQMAHRPGLDTSAQIALNRIIDMVEAGLKQSDQAEVKQWLVALKNASATALKEIYELCRNTTSGTAGNLLAEWIWPLVSVLPR